MALSKAMREKVLKRDNNQCWHCGEVEAISIQHRRNRQMGGSKLLDRLDNLIVLCSAMNSLIESDSNAANTAIDMGWKLASWKDFAAPIFNANTGEWFVLDLAGNIKKVDTPLYLI
jgi:5-methylcytosine-specific restriction endonuclease McrA